MEVNRRLTSFRLFPPMLSPPRSTTSIVSATTSSMSKNVAMDEPDDLDLDTKRRMKRLSMVVSAIHRKRVEEEKLKSNMSYHQLFPESSSAPQSFTQYRLHRKSHNDDMDFTGEKKTAHRSQDRKEFRFEHQDAEICQRVDFAIVKFEEERRMKVNQNVLKRKERLNTLVNKLREASIAKLEERLNLIYMEEDEINKSLERETVDAENRLLNEQRRLHEDFERRQRERDVRLQAAEIAAKAAAAKELAIEEHFQEIERQEAERERVHLLQQEQRQQSLVELKESLTGFKQIAEKSREIIEQNSLRLLLDQYGLDLSAIDDIIGGQAPFDADFVHGSKVALDEVTEMIESKFREVEDSREKYKREEKEKAERESLAKEKVECETATEKSFVETGSDDQVSSGNWQRFMQLKQFKQNFDTGVQTLLNDKEKKSFTFLCMKAVNTPVNAIGRATAALLMDKVKKLVLLLRGETVEVQETQFCAGAHPLGIQYCKTLLATKLVKQGEEVVRAQPKDAFTVASVVVALWSEFPDFGNLFLATLFETCPFLIPCFYGHQAGMSEENYYSKLGYNYDAAGKVEDQVTFESRMGGVARLYAAIMVSTLPKDSLKAKKDHPHGIGHAWNLIASMMNMKPENGVVTTILVNVIEVCGHALFDRYKGQFRHLLHVLATDYFTLIKNSSMEAPRNRLEMLLEKAITTGALKQPDGILNAGYL